MRSFTSLACLLLLAASCASSNYAKVQTENKNPNFKGGKGQNVLLVVAINDAFRTDVEDQFAIQAAVRDVRLTPSHRLIPDVNDVTKETLKGIVEKNGFDRVIVVRLVGPTSKGLHGDTTDAYRPMGDPGAFDPGMYKGMYNDVSSAVVFTPGKSSAPSSLGTYREGTFEARMFDGADQIVIWDQTTQVTSSPRTGDALSSYARAVLNGLRRSGLL